MNESHDIARLTPALRRYAQALSRDRAEAEDLVQETFLRAHERRGTQRAKRGLRPWLFAILHNLFVDRLRARRSSARREAEFATLSGTEGRPDAEDGLRLAQIRAMFGRLPEDQRAALHLVAIEEMTYAEAAAVLGIPPGTLMSRIARARAALRAMEEGRPALHVVGGRDDDADMVEGRMR